MLTAPARSA